MLKNKFKCAYRHYHSAIIDTIKGGFNGSIVPLSAPVMPVFGGFDSAIIDTPSRYCHRQGGFAQAPARWKINQPDGKSSKKQAEKGSEKILASKLRVSSLKIGV